MWSGPRRASRGTDPLTSAIRVSRVEALSDLEGMPTQMSFFDPFIRHEVKEALESGGEAFVSQAPGGGKNGLFIYDPYEATGTVFSRSEDAFERFFEMKSSSYIFSELEVRGHQKEVWNIWQLDVDKAAPGHRFRHQVSMDDDAGEIEKFMAATQPETNSRWISVALRNGDKCFVVRVGDRVVGMAWMSIVGGWARSHGLYVEPRFRRMGVMTDNLQARLIYLKSRRVHTLVNEIAESNVASSRHAESAGERVAGKICLYTTPG